jgi:hypothetical protein
MCASHAQRLMDLYGIDETMAVHTAVDVMHTLHGASESDDFAAVNYPNVRKMRQRLKLSGR